VEAKVAAAIEAALTDVDLRCLLSRLLARRALVVAGQSRRAENDGEGSQNELGQP
jgi:hypothetical protein